MSPLIILTATVGAFLAMWGTQTRGRWSPAIGTSGGLIWLTAVIWEFVEFGLQPGVLFLLFTFIIGNLFSRVIPRVP